VSSGKKAAFLKRMFNGCMTGGMEDWEFSFCLRRAFTNFDDKVEEDEISASCFDSDKFDQNCDLT
jgi:hypothetical protein